MNYKNIFTGSSETEEQLRKFLQAATALTDGVPRETFNDEYMFKVMTEGRNGPDDRYPGSQSPDDTGGFFIIEKNGMVYLTPKAHKCVTV